MFLGEGVQLVCEADNLPTICESVVMSRQYGILDILQPDRPPCPLTGLTFSTVCNTSRRHSYGRKALYIQKELHCGDFGASCLLKM
jgi:hypothetical protein